MRLRERAKPREKDGALLRDPGAVPRLRPQARKNPNRERLGFRFSGGPAGIEPSVKKVLLVLESLSIEIR
jgi:hypothetical protein